MACVKAKEWFTQCRGGPLHSSTVETACKDYVTNQKQEKGERSAAYSEGRFKQHVYGKDIARKKLDELTSRDVTNWRNGLLSSMKKRSANRVLRSFKAALNYAFHQSMCPSDAAWRRVNAFKGAGAADGARTVFLTVDQRQRLLSACEPHVADLLRGLLYTGARPLSNAELPVAKIDDFDAQQKTITLRNYKGDGSERVRVVPLAEAAVEFFQQMCKNKPPPEYLFMNGPDRWRRHMWSSAIASAVKSVNKQADNERKPANRLPEDTCAYTMRHCAITDWLKAGISIGQVAKDAGTSIAMIEKYYAKYLDDAELRARLNTVASF
jgi:integrase